jgi:hypothetical protein
MQLAEHQPLPRKHHRHPHTPRAHLDHLPLLMRRARPRTFIPGGPAPPHALLSCQRPAPRHRQTRPPTRRAPAHGRQGNTASVGPTTRIRQPQRPRRHPTAASGTAKRPPRPATDGRGRLQHVPQRPAEPPRPRQTTRTRTRQTEVPPFRLTG